MVAAVMKKTEAVSACGFSTTAKLMMAVGGVTIGILLLVAGMLAWAISAVDQQNHDYLELILIGAAFAFLGLGAHGLDLLHSAKRAEQKRRLNL